MSVRNSVIHETKGFKVDEHTSNTEGSGASSLNRKTLPDLCVCIIASLTAVQTQNSKPACNIFETLVLSPTSSVFS